jgi:hypothetical protein
VNQLLKDRPEAQRLGITVEKLLKEERPAAQRLGMTVDDLLACRLNGLTAVQKQQLDELRPLVAGVLQPGSTLDQQVPVRKQVEALLAEVELLASKLKDAAPEILTLTQAKAAELKGLLSQLETPAERRKRLLKEAAALGFGRDVGKFEAAKEEAAALGMDVKQLVEDRKEAQRLGFEGGVTELYAAGDTAAALTSSSGLTVSVSIVAASTKLAKKKGLAREAGISTIVISCVESAKALAGEEEGAGGGPQQLLDSRAVTDLYALKEEAAVHQADTGGAVAVLLGDKRELQSFTKQLHTLTELYTARADAKKFGVDLKGLLRDRIEAKERGVEMGTLHALRHESEAISKLCGFEVTVGNCYSFSITVDSLQQQARDANATVRVVCASIMLGTPQDFSKVLEADNVFQLMKNERVFYKSDVVGGRFFSKVYVDGDGRVSKNSKPPSGTLPFDVVWKDRTPPNASGYDVDSIDNDSQEVTIKGVYKFENPPIFPKLEFFTFVKECEKLGGNAVHAACRHGCAMTVETLVVKQKKRELATKMDDQFLTPLHIAAQKGHYDIAAFLFRWAQCNSKAFGGPPPTTKTPFDLAFDDDTRDKLKSLGAFGIAMMCTGSGFQLADVATDITVIISYSNPNHVALGCTFLLLGPVVLTAFDLIQYKTEQGACSLAWKVVLNFTGTRIVFESVQSVRFGSKSGDLSMAKIIEAVFEAFPQSVFQVYVMITERRVNIVSIVSVSASIINIGFAAASEGDFSALQIESIFTWQAFIVFFYRGAETLARIAICAMMFAKWHNYAWVFIAVEWVFVLIYFIAGPARGDTETAESKVATWSSLATLTGKVTVNMAGTYLGYDHTLADNICEKKEGSNTEAYLMGQLRSRDFLALVTSRVVFNITFAASLMISYAPDAAENTTQMNSTSGTAAWESSEATYYWAWIASSAVPLQMLTALAIVWKGPSWVQREFDLDSDLGKMLRTDADLAAMGDEDFEEQFQIMLKQKELREQQKMRFKRSDSQNAGHLV